MNRKYTVIDLFSGCGGFSQGFLKEGFEILAANEIWQPAIETYKFNHKNTIMIEGDITNPEIKKKLYESIKDKKINVVIGGPPCQAYSSAGNRNPDDPRGQLYLDFIEIIDHIKPDFFVMENVKGLINMKHVRPSLTKNELKEFKESCKLLQRYKDLKRYGAQRKLTRQESNEFRELKSSHKELEKKINHYLIPLIDKILIKFNDINYNVIWKVLNSANYGVAQFRERVIFIGTKNERINLQFPPITHSGNGKLVSNTKNENKSKNQNLRNWIPVKQVLKQYENWEENPQLNHLFTRHSKEFIKRLSKVPIGENLYKNYNDAWWRLDPEKPARTVKENHGGVFIHYKFDRVCTPRELAALQSFSDDFIFKGTKSAILKQIGNAVPPLMAKAIARQIKNHLDEIYLK
ncbi:MAG: DNA cytosine methyltransferase [Promethearchaeota archaeon]